MSISNENEKTKGPFSPQVNMAINVRDELKGLIQEAGLGASVTLASIDEADKPKVYSSLKYPKTGLDVLWGGIANLHSHENLMVCIVTRILYEWSLICYVDAFQPQRGTSRLACHSVSCSPYCGEIPWAAHSTRIIPERKRIISSRRATGKRLTLRGRSSKDRSKTWVITDRYHQLCLTFNF